MSSLNPDPVQSSGNFLLEEGQGNNAMINHEPELAIETAFIHCLRLVLMDF